MFFFLRMLSFIYIFPHIDHYGAVWTRNEIIISICHKIKTFISKDSTTSDYNNKIL